MTEANVEVYRARAGELVAAVTQEIKILHEFRRTRQNLADAGTPMTGAQKAGTLALLKDARTAREAAVVLVDEVFDATDPITG